MSFIPLSYRAEVHINKWKAHKRHSSVLPIFVMKISKQNVNYIIPAVLLLIPFLLAIYSFSSIKLT